MSQQEKCVRAVIEGCAERGVQVSDELASVFYKSCIVYPNINLQKNLSGKTVVKEIVVKQCIDRLCVHNDPVVACVKMQLLLEHEYRNREFVINKVNEDIDQKLEPILNEIVDNVNTIQCDENNIYYQRLIQYIILANHIGDPTTPACVQKTSGVLNDIINRNGLSDFKDQSQSLKKKQLKEIANLVCAVTLHDLNRRECKKEIIFDMVDNLPTAADSLLQNIDRELEDSSKKVTTFTSWIRQCYRVDKDLLAPIFAVRIRMADIRIDELKRLKIFLVIYLQCIKNLETMKSDVIKCKIELLPLLDKYNLALTEIRKNFKINDDIDDIIFPRLINLSAIWSEIMDIVNYLSTTANFVLTMKQMKNEVVIVKEHGIKILPTTDIIPTINEDEQLKIIETLHPLHPMCKWYPPSSNAIDRRNLFADGYCVVMLVETEGTLIKHDAHLGMIQYTDVWFSFSCIQAALNFGTNPSYYLNCFFNLLRSQAHLLFFFNLYEQIADKQYISNKQMRSKYKDVVIHPYKTTINGSRQNTNEIKNCTNQQNMHNMVTQSTQTQDVYKSVQLQTSSKHNVASNTMSEKGTSTSQSMAYL